MFVAIDGALAGLVGVADPIKSSTPEAIATLHQRGLKVVMLTGDSETTARAVAEQLGIDEVVAGVLPDQKAAKVRALQEAGAVVAMAGDGINDAPVLALADVGIAMGTGTDVAMESASVTLVKGDLRGIVRALELSRKTMANNKQNLVFAFGYNSLGGSARRRPALSVLRCPPQSHVRGGRDEPQLGIGHRQCAPPPPNARLRQEHRRQQVGDREDTRARSLATKVRPQRRWRRSGAVTGNLGAARASSLAEFRHRHRRWNPGGDAHHSHPSHRRR